MPPTASVGLPSFRSMKLLFDQNLSWHLPQKLSDLYPDSRHVREFGMKESQDIDVWDYAKAHGFVIVTKDLDFQQRSLLFGHPPKVVRLRVGNCPVQTIEDLLRRYAPVIQKFEADAQKSYLSLP